jgi:hypothetical protein
MRYSNSHFQILISQNDHEDFSAILQQVIPDCPERLKTFLTSQRDAVLRKSTGRRWNKGDKFLFFASFNIQ